MSFGSLVLLFSGLLAYNPVDVVYTVMFQHIVDASVSSNAISSFRFTMMFSLVLLNMKVFVYNFWYGHLCIVLVSHMYLLLSNSYVKSLTLHPFAIISESSVSCSMVKVVNVLLLQFRQTRYLWNPTGKLQQQRQVRISYGRIREILRMVHQ
jgi:hypothetical protein